MRWFELLIEGREDALVSLLEENTAEIFRGSELRLAESSIAGRVLGFLRAKTHHLVFASAAQARELIRRIPEHPKLRLEGIREVAGGRFGFEAEAYNREVGRKIHDTLTSDLPPGIDCLDLEKEETHPDAKGIELFTPAHEYVYKARGTIVGTPPGILEMNRRIVRLDFVHEEPMELETREASEKELG